MLPTILTRKKPYFRRLYLHAPSSGSNLSNLTTKKVSSESCPSHSSLSRCFGQRTLAPSLQRERSAVFWWRTMASGLEVLILCLPGRLECQQQAPNNIPISLG